MRLDLTEIIFIVVFLPLMIEILISPISFPSFLLFLLLIIFGLAAVWVILTD